MSKPKVYTVWNRPPNKPSPRGKVSMTDARYMDECDISKILERYRVTGQLPVNPLGTYADVSDIGSFDDVMAATNRAREAFESQPSDLRARFGNDPRAFYRFVLNPDNKEECFKLGLLNKAVSQEDSPLALLKAIRDGVTAKAAAPATPDAGTAVNT